MLARFVTSCVVVAVAGLALMPEAASAQKRGGTLVMLVQPEPPTLASNISTSGPIGQVATKVYEDLLEYDFALKPVPGLAESWTVSPDGRTITFRRTFGEGQDSSHDEAPGNLVDIARCQRQPETGRWGSRRHVGSVASPLGVLC